MAWTLLKEPPRQRFVPDGTPVVHDGRIVWLWRSEHAGRSYDPSRDRWAKIVDPPCFTRLGAAVVSTGAEILVWGGEEFEHVWQRPGVRKGNGFRFAAGTWREMAKKRAPGARRPAVRIWTGSELVIWGGLGAKALGNGAAYRPDDDAWRPVSASGAPEPRHRCQVVWTGEEVWVWGGSDPRVRDHAGFWKWSLDGAAYHPAHDRWRPLAPLPLPPDEGVCARGIARLEDGALFVWRDQASGCWLETLSAWRYDSPLDRWKPAASPPGNHVEHKLADCALIEAAGHVLLASGGQILEYDPARDRWKAHPTLAVERFGHLVSIGKTLFALQTGKAGPRGARLELG